MWCSNQHHCVIIVIIVLIRFGILALLSWQQHRLALRHSTESQQVFQSLADYHILQIVHQNFKWWIWTFWVLNCRFKKTNSPSSEEIPISSAGIQDSRILYSLFQTWPKFGRGQLKLQRDEEECSETKPRQRADLTDINNSLTTPILTFTLVAVVLTWKYLWKMYFQV